MKQSKKKKKPSKRTSQRRANVWMYVAVVGVMMLVIGSAVLSANPPAASTAAASRGPMGEPAAILSAEHIPASSSPGPYSTNPPAGGVHYEPDFEAGFYDETDVAGLPQNPEGYLVHNLEHGYVIFWYNCEAGVDCAALKQTIQDVMQTAARPKLIAFPWPDMDVPLALTSWGRILEFEDLDTDQMLEFVRRNYNQAPEPNMT